MINNNISSLITDNQSLVNYHPEGHYKCNSQTPTESEVLKDSLKIKKRIKYGILSLIKIKILSL